MCRFSVERPKAIRPASSSLRRTSSLDTIGPYLQGKWPVDGGCHHHTQSSGTFMADKQTQVCYFIFFDFVALISPDLLEYGFHYRMFLK